MIKLIINYDMIDKIHEAKDEYKLRLIYKGYINNPINSAPLTMLTGYCLYNIFNGIDVPINEAILIFELSELFIALPTFILSYDKLVKARGMKTLREKAMDEIKELSLKLNDQNIKTTSELLLKSNVYHKKYKLTNEGIPGVIRERYISVPTYGFSGKEKEISILEEHRLGSKKYILTLGSPKKILSYKKAYGM